MASYLMKYKGVYRLRTPIDEQKLTFPREYNGSFAENDIYIDCLNNVKIFHYGKQILQAYIPSIGRGHNIVKEIKSVFYDGIITHIEETDSKVLFRFNAKHMEDFEPILKPRTSGASRSPFSSKNLPKIKYDIPKDDIQKYKDMTSHISKEDMLKISHATKGFLASLCNKKYTDEMLKADMALKCLGNKEYIHSIGKWSDYITYLEKNLWFQNKI